MKSSRFPCNVHGREALEAFSSSQEHSERQWGSRDQGRDSAADFSVVRAPEFSAPGAPLTCHQTANNRPKHSLRKTKENKHIFIVISLNMLAIVELRLTRLE